MNESSHSNMTVAVVGNPTSNKGRGAKTGEQVISLLQSAGDRHGFEVIDVTGTSFEDSLVKAKSRRDEYDYLVDSSCRSIVWKPPSTASSAP